LAQESKTLGYGVDFKKTMEENDSVTELERIKAKRAMVFSFKILMCGGRKHRKKLEAPLRMNSELTLEEIHFF
jgi:hypothetical protein